LGDTSDSESSEFGEECFCPETLETLSLVTLELMLVVNTNTVSRKVVTRLISPNTVSVTKEVDTSGDVTKELVTCTVAGVEDVSTDELDSEDDGNVDDTLDTSMEVDVTSIDDVFCGDDDDDIKLTVDKGIEDSVDNVLSTFISSEVSISLPSIVGFVNI